MNLIELDNISKTYESGGHLHRTRVRAVRNVSLKVRQGECLGLVGESGSGKSTLGRIAVGLETPSEGKVICKGKVLDAGRMDRESRKALQMVYQNSFEATNPRFTARQVIEEPLRYFRLARGEEAERKIHGLLDRVGIPAAEADKKAHEFSGGQLQRICIARALASDPEMILLDEPLSSLDVSIQAQILNLLKRLKEELGLTYLLISHDLETVYNLSDRVAVMYAGKIMEEIDEIELFERLEHPYTRLLLEGTAGGASPMSPGKDGEGGCVYADRCPLAKEICREKEPALEEKEAGHRIACHMCK